MEYNVVVSTRGPAPRGCLSFALQRSIVQRGRTFQALLLVALTAWSGAAQPLPLADIPPGKVLLSFGAHHDDHTWQYGWGGLIAKMTDAGYTGYWVRVTNDEKDGSRGWGQNSIDNYEDTLEAVRELGIQEVLNLDWRNDHMDSIPLLELRGHLILLIRKHRPDVVTAFLPWGHYDRNPDHRKVSRAIGEAVWMAGYANVHPEHLEMGLKPHRVPYCFYSFRKDYGKGYEPTVAVELNEDQVRRKARAYRLHRIRVSPRAGRRVRQALGEKGLVIPELEGLSDEEAHIQLQEWFMEWYSARTGKQNGVRFAEVFHLRDEWDHLPGLKDYLKGSAVGENAVQP